MENKGTSGCGSVIRAVVDLITELMTAMKWAVTHTKYLVIILLANTAKLDLNCAFCIEVQSATIVLEVRTMGLLHIESKVCRSGIGMHIDDPLWALRGRRPGLRTQ